MVKISTVFDVQEDIWISMISCDNSVEISITLSDGEFYIIRFGDDGSVMREPLETFLIGIERAKAELSKTSI